MDYPHRTVFTTFLLCIGLQMVSWNHLHQETSSKFIMILPAPSALQQCCMTCPVLSRGLETQQPPTAREKQQLLEAYPRAQ